MARTVADVTAIFEVTAGWDPDDPASAPVPLRQFDRPSDLIVGYFEDDGRTPVTRETRAAVKRAAEGVAAAGYRVEAFRPTGLERARQLWDIFFCEIALQVLNEPMHGAEVELPILFEYLRRGSRPNLTGLALTHVWMERDQVRADLLRQMTMHRVFLCPVASVPAFKHGEREWKIDGRTVDYLDAMSYTQWFNILGNPAAVVPVGTSPEGLPIGVQIVGRPHEEELVLQVAAAIERECGGFKTPPISS